MSDSDSNSNSITHTLARLRATHTRVAEMWLAGVADAEIAAETGLTEVAITRITTSPLFRVLVARRSRDGSARART